MFLLNAVKSKIVNVSQLQPCLDYFITPTQYVTLL